MSEDLPHPKDTELHDAVLAAAREIAQEEGQNKLAELMVSLSQRIQALDERVAKLGGNTGTSPATASLPLAPSVSDEQIKGDLDIFEKF